MWLIVSFKNEHWKQFDDSFGWHGHAAAGNHGSDHQPACHQRVTVGIIWQIFQIAFLHNFGVMVISPFNLEIQVGEEACWVWRGPRPRDLHGRCKFHFPVSTIWKLKNASRNSTFSFTSMGVSCWANRKMTKIRLRESSHRPRAVPPLTDARSALNQLRIDASHSQSKHTLETVSVCSTAWYHLAIFTVIMFSAFVTRCKIK